MRNQTKVAVAVAVCVAGVLGWAGETPATMGLPEGAVARLGLGWITCVAYAPGGKWLAVGTSLGVELREAGSLELVALLTGHTEPVFSVAFSPDGALLASGSLDTTVKL
ncbi:MAG: hypothetical protein N2320_06810, partial [Candidatus Bipolaricaulota bacterium]|nr:hypothetical protein [Candidatus Bipolaricaulota bacterium]